MWAIWLQIKSNSKCQLETQFNDQSKLSRELELKSDSRLISRRVTRLILSIRVKLWCWYRVFKSSQKVGMKTRLDDQSNLKHVESLVESLIENSIENLVENSVERSIESSMRSLIEDSIENLIERLVGNLVGNSVGNLIERLIESLVENLIESLIESSISSLEECVLLS